jgi:SOS-response transcriptional repressor LexA
MPKTKNDEIFKEIGLLIKKRREELGYTQTKLAELISMEPISVQRFESGYSKIAIDYLVKIAKILKVEISYFFSYNKTKSNIPSLPAYSVFDETAIDESKYQMLPVIAFAGAGKFIDLAEIEPIDKLLIPKEFTINGSTIIVKVAGASMEPMIRKGAYIGVDKDDKQFTAGEIYAIYLPYEGAVIKRVYLDLDNIILKSENKNFPDMVIPTKKVDRENFIIGKVKWVLQKF